MLPWSDNWWIDGKRAYFCGAEITALFCIDLDGQQGEMISRIPECGLKDFRINSFCIKYEEIVYCLPCRGENVWCYDLIKKCWNKIRLKTEPNVVKSMCPVVCNGKTWVRDCQCGKIIEIDLTQKKVAWEYNLPISSNNSYGRYVLVNNELYCVDATMICCINIKTREIKNYDLSDLGMILFTVFYDGENFWLSGNQKEIYIWNPKDGIVKVITEFPDKFGVYQHNKNNELELNSTFEKDNKNFLFDHAIGVGRYVWFLPFYADHIVYVDRKSYRIGMLEIDIKQSKNVIKKNKTMDRQLLEYIRDERYIGIYSSKTDRIFEIDTDTLRVEFRNYSLSDKSCKELAEKACLENSILSEGHGSDNELYSYMIKSDFGVSDKKTEHVGERIYKELLL